MTNEQRDAYKKPNNTAGWIKKHKKEIITVIAIGVSTILIIVVEKSGLDNKEKIEKAILDKENLLNGIQVPTASETIAETVFMSSPLVVQDITSNEPFDVKAHIRKLHEGWEPSAEKIAETTKIGITLEPGQTWVDQYSKGKTA